MLAGYGFGTLPPDECMRRARAAALKAIEIDDTLAEAHASLAMVKAYHEFDHAGAEILFRRAVELNPSYATAHHWYSDFLAEAGRPEEALAEAEREEARRWLERTREKIGSRPALAVLLRTDPMYESLRADPAFRSLFEVTA